LVPHHERIVLVEDTPELAVGHPHVVGLSTRGANVEGAGAIGLRELVRQSLRMRPDRLVVGEFRGAEMVELLVALNTGHDGGAATLHANTASLVPARVSALGALAGLSGVAVASLASAALHVVIHLHRVGTVRRVEEVAIIDGSGSSLRTTPAWRRAAGAGPGADVLAGWLAERDVTVPGLLR
jgi:pilus assembly protein CpaF